MFPVLLELGPIQLTTSFVAAILAFFLAMYVFWRKSREEHYAEDEVYDVFLISTFWAVLASRVGYVILHINTLGVHPLKWLDVIGHPGFFPLIGLLVGGVSVFRAAKRRKWDEYELLDFAVMAASAAMALLWLGNFFSGAELGTATQLPWGVQFPSVFDRRHPVQLYGFVLYGLLFWYLSWVERRYRTFSWYRAKKDSAQSGYLFAVFCIAIGFIGLFLGVFRSVEVLFFGVSIDMLIRVVLIPYGLFTLFQRSGRTVPFLKGRK